MTRPGDPKQGGQAPTDADTRTVHFVLPAYNEAASIGDLLDRIDEVCASAGIACDVLVVDDGSDDETGSVARSRSARMPVTVIRNTPNRGLGFTIARGLREVSGRVPPGDVIVTLDADLTQDPAYVPSMLDALGRGADVVIASRYRRGSAVEGLSLVRTMLSYAASGLVALLRRVPGMRDYSCGFRAYRASVIQLGFETYGDRFVSETGFACMVEIAQRLRGRAVFTEIPFVLHYDAKRKQSEIRILKTMRAYVRVLLIVRAEDREARKARFRR